MDQRFKLWLVVTLGLFILNGLISTWLFPPAPKPVDDKAKAVAKAEDGKVKNGQKDAPIAADEQVNPEKPEVAVEKDAPAVEAAPKAEEAPAEEAIPASWITFGSADPNSPYRMLVTATNVGAAIERIELNSPKYRDIDDRSGYLGQLTLESVPKSEGARIRTVGMGTPAALAGLKVDDVIVEMDKAPIISGAKFEELLETKKPGETAKIAVKRGDQRQEIAVPLIRRPVAMVHPEYKTESLNYVSPGKHDPFSFLMTLQTIGDRSLIAPEDGGFGKELDGISLWTAPWEVTDQREDSVSFRKVLPGLNIELTKKFTLAKKKNNGSEDDPSYHLEMEVGVRNTGEQAQTLAYQLNGPTGLPAEGAWYASKVSRTWGAAGLRDVIVRFNNGKPHESTCTTIANNEAEKFVDTPLDYIAVDAQYFSGALIPRKSQADASWFSDVRSMRVGALPAEKADYKKTNVSFRLTTKAELLEPSEGISHKYVFFTGPKRPSIVEKYTAIPFVEAAPVTLEDLIYYGWFDWVAKPMLRLLHGFYWLLPNYGAAIILLTILVRGAMFPISRKQAISGQKMQELQPQIKALAEKYKNNPQERQRAQMELFRKNNYNPLAGCLPMFLQLPIFIGLYRSLMVDVELRDAPLISDAVRWCSNLAAPDMFLDWSRWMFPFVVAGQGFFGLGPYLNILPLFTIALFIWQQKMFMPPPTDEQTAMQQKMMKYMMVFMGFMFFKVASGLCLYFIASSLWGISERKMLPKTLPKTNGNAPTETAKKVDSASSNGSATGKNKKKQRN